MSGGGTAPSMKMSDVFILVGMSVLVGGFIMHAWTSPTLLDFESPTLESGASMLKGDTMTFEITPNNESTVVIMVMDESGATAAEQSWTVAGGEAFDYRFEATEGGFYTYTVTFETGEGEAFVDVDRSSMIDFIAYPFGVACVAFGLYKRGLEKNEALDEVLDAELEG
jgi:hypothetical protein